MTRRSLALAVVFGAIALGVAGPSTLLAMEYKNVVISNYDDVLYPRLVWWIPEEGEKAQDHVSKLAANCQTTIDKNPAKPNELQSMMVATLKTGENGRLERIDAASVDYRHPLMAECLATEERDAYRLWAKEGISDVFGFRKRSLEILRLKKGRLTAEMVESIGQFPNLTALSLDECRVEKGAVEAFPAHPRLQRISFDKVLMNRAAFEQFAHCPSLEYLLAVRCTGLKGRALEPLANAPKLLWFSGWETDLADEGLECLAGCKSLQHLLISKTSVTDKGIESLRDLDLRTAHLWGTKITDRSVDVMLKWPHLTGLAVHETGISGNGVLRLMKHPGVRELWIDARLPGPVLDQVRREFKGSQLYIMRNTVIASMRGPLAGSGLPQAAPGAAAGGGLTPPGSANPAQSGTARPGSATPARIGPKPNF